MFEETAGCLSYGRFFTGALSTSYRLTLISPRIWDIMHDGRVPGTLSRKVFQKKATQCQQQFIYSLCVTGWQARPH